METGENYPNSLPSGYRPIIVLALARKIIERHVKATIENFYRQFSSCPASLLSQYSLKFWTTGNVLWIKVTKYMHSVIHVSKVFDTVPHLPLLQKLRNKLMDKWATSKST